MAYQREFDRTGAVMFKQHGVMPSVWGEQTPHQLHAVMFGEASNAVRPSEPLAPLAVLAKLNRQRADKGLSPVTGAMFKGVLESVPNA